MDLPKAFYRVSVKALVLDATRTKFLVVQDERGHWELPGGGMRQGCSPQDELRREIREEMSLETVFVADQPFYFITDANNGTVWRANVVYEIKLCSFDFTPSSECIAIQFVSPEEASKLDALENVHKLGRVFNATAHAQPEFHMKRWYQI